MKHIVILLLAVIFYSSTSLAVNISACSGMLNDGWYKKYKYGGIDQPLTKATKKHGSTKSTFVTTTEGTTALSDPGYWSNVTTSQTQWTSSWGDCSAIGLKRVKEIRELYYAQNKDEILKEMSKGTGMHIDALAAYSLCDLDASNALGGEFQGSISDFIQVEAGGYGDRVDYLVRNNPVLKAKCFDFKNI